VKERYGTLVGLGCERFSLGQAVWQDCQNLPGWRVFQRQNSIETRPGGEEADVMQADVKQADVKQADVEGGAVLTGALEVFTVAASVTGLAAMTAPGAVPWTD